MKPDGIGTLLKQLRHLPLGKPDSISIKFNLNISISIRSGVYYNF